MQSSKMNQMVDYVFQADKKTVLNLSLAVFKTFQVYCFIIFFGKNKQNLITVKFYDIA